jgi:prolyl-tRNA editing enzyme YbaK/EbsC (Cys-tRNA(Pro) deacylase)
MNLTRFIIVRKKKQQGKQNIKESLKLNRHTWLVFASAIEDTILPKIISSSYRWGIKSHLSSGTVVEPKSFKTRFLMELNYPVDALKVRFFLSEIFHLSPTLIGEPFIVDNMNQTFLKNAIVENEDQCDSMDSGDINARNYIASDILRLLDEYGEYSLYVHPAVSTMKSVWEVLGVPASKMLNTQVFMNKLTKSLAFCCVKGDSRVDTDKVSSIISENYKRVALAELVSLGQNVGAVSPLTAPSGANILVDKKVEETDLLFMGSGHPNISVVINPHRGWPMPVRIEDIAEAK